MDKKNDRTAVLLHGLEEGAGRMLTRKNRQVTIYAVCCLFVILSILLNSGRAFEYTTGKTAKGYIYVPASGEEVRQRIPSGQRVLKGINIRFVPMDETEAGEIKVCFYKNDEEIQTWEILSTELTEDQYRQFRFDRPVKTTEEDKCRFTITETYEASELSTNQIGVCKGGSVVIREDADSDTIDGIIYSGDIEGEESREAEQGPEKKAVCYQMTIEDPAMRAGILPGFIIILVLLCIAGGFLVNFHKVRMRRMLALTLFLVVFAGTAATGLMRNIARDATVSGFRTEDVAVRLEPGETIERSFAADLCDFSAFEFSIAGGDSRSDTVHVRLQKADEEEPYFDGDIYGRTMLDGGPEGRRVRISAEDTEAGDKFPMGVYQVSITNLDESRRLRLSMIEKGLMEEAAAEEDQTGEETSEEEQNNDELEGDTYYSEEAAWDTEEESEEEQEEPEIRTELNYALIRTSGLGYRIAYAVFLILLAYVLLLTAILTRGWITTERFFLVSAVPLGIIYLILMLPWSPPDTGSHILYANRLSNGMMGAATEDLWKVRAEDAAYFPAEWREEEIRTPQYPCMEDYAVTFLRTKESGKIMSGESLPEQADQDRDSSSENSQNTAGIDTLRPDENGMVEYFADVKMEYYSILNYLPQVLGLTLGKLMGLSSVAAIYLGRILILVLYIAAFTYAIRITPVGKSVFAGIGLLPMCLMFSSSYSYDAMVLISTISFIAAVLAACHAPGNRRFCIESAFWAFVIGAVKGGGYLILLPMVLILTYSRKTVGSDEPVEIRRERFEQHKKTLLWTGGIAAAGLVSVLLFDLILPKAALFQFGETGTGRLTFSYALLHPLRYLQMLLGSFITNADALFLNVAGTRLTWLENTIPAVFIAGLLGIIAVWTLFENDALRFRPRDKRIFMFVIGLELFLTPAMLLSWTRVDAAVIEGLQGRYFLPVLPLVYFVLAKFRLARNVDCPANEESFIHKTCMVWFCMLSCLCVYSMLCLYLTR